MSTLAEHAERLSQLAVREFPDDKAVLRAGAAALRVVLALRALREHRHVTGVCFKLPTDVLCAERKRLTYKGLKS